MQGAAPLTVDLFLSIDECIDVALHVDLFVYTCAHVACCQASDERRSPCPSGIFEWYLSVPASQLSKTYCAIFGP